MRRDGVTWASYLSLGLFTFFLNIQGNILPFLRDAFGLSYLWVTFHPAALAVGLILIGLIGERVIAAFGRRRTIIIGLVGLVIGALLIVVAPSPIVSVAGCFTMGLVGAGVLITVPGLLAEWHGEHAAAALGEANGFSYGASLLAALSTSLFIALGLDWQSGLVLGAVLVAILTGFAGRQGIPDAPPHPKGGKGHLSAAYWMYWLALAGAVGVEQTTLVWAPAFLEGTKDISRSMAASGGALFSAGMLIGRVASAPLMARMSPTTALYGSFALLLPAFVVYWGAPWPMLALPGLFALGLGTALLYPLILSQSIRLAGPLGDTASARASLASGIAILIFPLAVGSLADTAGLKIALMVVPVLAVVSLGCLVVGERMAAGNG